MSICGGHFEIFCLGLGSTPNPSRPRRRPLSRPFPGCAGKGESLADLLPHPNPFPSWRNAPPPIRKTAEEDDDDKDEKDWR
jgi:hypothetical protein